MLFLVVVGILVLAYHLEVSRIREDNEIMFLACTWNEKDEDTYKWSKNNVVGKVFESLHVVIIMISAMQAERAFYSIPHKMGFFNKLDVPGDLDII